MNFRYNPSPLNNLFKGVVFYESGVRRFFPHRREFNGLSLSAIIAIVVGPGGSSRLVHPHDSRLHCVPDPGNLFAIAGETLSPLFQSEGRASGFVEGQP